MRPLSRQLVEQFKAHGWLFLDAGVRSRRFTKRELCGEIGQAPYFHVEGHIQPVRYGSGFNLEIFLYAAAMSGAVKLKSAWYPYPEAAEQHGSELLERYATAYRLGWRPGQGDPA